MTIKSAKLSGKVAVFSIESGEVIGIGENYSAAHRNAFEKGNTDTTWMTEVLPISIDALVKLGDGVMPMIAVLPDGATGRFIGSTDQYNAESSDQSHTANCHRRFGTPYWRATI